MDFSKIQNPRVRQYLEDKYAKQQEVDAAKENEALYGGLADAGAGLATAAINSTPRVQFQNKFSDLGKAPRMGEGYEGKVDASPVKQMLNRQTVGAQEGLAKIGQDFEEQNKLDQYSRGEAAYEDESNPNSETSKQYQALAKKFMPNGNYEGVSAAKLKQLMPPLEKAYQYDQQKAQRAEDLSERRKDRATQFAIAQGNRQDQRAVRAEEKLNQETQKVADTLGGNQPAITAIQQLEKELGAPLEAFNVENGSLSKDGKAVDLPGVSVPGVGRVTAYDSKAQNLQAAADRIFNVTLKDRSGAAVTTPEMDRLKSEFTAGIYNSEAQLIQALQAYKAATRDALKASEAGYRPEAVQQYEERGGRTSKTLNAPSVGTGQRRVTTADDLE